MEKVDLRDGAVLERNRPYLIPLAEEVRLPEVVRGRCNPKSSTGRLDIFTRCVTDRSHLFDDIAPGYTGQLWLEVVSRSFTVRVRRGLRLNQLRLSQGKSEIGATQLTAHHRHDPLVVEPRAREAGGPLAAVAGGGLFLSLDLRYSDSEAPAGWRAKKNSRLIDLERIGGHDPRDFWEPVLAERGGGVVLEPEEFYLLMSKEEVRIAPQMAAEMTAYDTTSGELRTHYAGFFDPGFGYRPQILSHGSRAALEVRAHDVPFKVEDGQRVCRLSFQHMLETPDYLYGSEESHYQYQAETLSKHFRHDRPAHEVPSRPPTTEGYDPGVLF